MRTVRRSVLIALSLAMLAAWFVTSGSTRAIAQGTTEEEADPLVTRQSSVAQRYARLEELLLRLADVEARENPERAALLKRVAKQSREKFVLEKMRDASDLISNGQLSKALEDQKTATTELEGLLKLLMSEDRSSRIRDERKRITEIIKQLRLTERNERSVRARTENGVDLDEVAKEQKEIAERAEALSQELDAQDESDPPESSKESDSKKASSESTPGENGQAEETSKPKESSDGSKPNEESKPKGDPKPKGESEPKGESQSSSESKPDGEKKPSSDPNSSDPKPASEQRPSGESKPSGESTPQDSPQSPKPPPTPEQLAEQQLEKAVEKMKEAQQKLADNERGEATEKQRQAEEEIRKAIDRLEKILRQLREEEIQRELAKLEARLRKMAAMQSAILDETVQLAKTPQSQRNRTTDLKAGDLAFEEQKITLEADRAMLLLREEGSSVAFPEVILQLREDTKRVATRLGQSKIDVVTQGIQSDILAALEEMIGALAKAQRENEKKQQEQKQGQPSQQGSQEQPLVEALAELKLIRTMQTRIQSTTDRYGDLLESDNAQQPDAGGTSKRPGGIVKSETEKIGEDVLPLLRNLAQRQDRLYQLTRDLVTKRNR